MFQPMKAPWLRAGAVLHEKDAPLPHLLTDFARAVQGRGFRVAGIIAQSTDQDGMTSLLDLQSGLEHLVGTGSQGLRLAAHALREALREDVDLVILNDFAAFRDGANEMLATLADDRMEGMPILTSLPGENVHQWFNYAGQKGNLLTPTMRSLWRWWGTEKLYEDLSFGVRPEPIRDVIAGQRWLMVRSIDGCGLCHLPRKGRSDSDVADKVQQWRQQTLSQLSQLACSWDPLDMAVGTAALCAHYNRSSFFARHPETLGNGLSTLSQEHHPHAEGKRTVIVGAFPGLSELFPQSYVVENNPRPGEYPPSALEDLLPGCHTAVISSAAFVNRSLPRLLSLMSGTPSALVGLSTPLSDRLHAYGLQTVGGFLVTDPEGLAHAVLSGASAKDFSRYGHYRHRRYQHPQANPGTTSLCRYRRLRAAV